MGLVHMATLAVASMLFLIAGLVVRSSGSASTTAMTVPHIFLVSFKPSASRETIQAIHKRIIAFRTDCLDPDGKPYVLATKGGINNNPEHSVKKMTHGFIMEFKNEADRQ
ncbi:hypothetical protein QBC33DRAFT_590790 [Phialemonium atrogriseum]|uniref:Stress-response A/B barrel domain-containing protein n=1 Tax=Phialemonium atrogriseum TaxID=1093897 RepID=A0AAJ0FFF4_9PEZI|nr:uncharacterized protein QBC33DRAFT_590790 [Phialemonium atrogriseum]KAK1765402.1 hypothetical protein QBC33DRAFT_590790 [Phialemonium atrogriseum]